MAPPDMFDPLMEFGIVYDKSWAALLSVEVGVGPLTYDSSIPLSFFR